MTEPTPNYTIAEIRAMLAEAEAAEAAKKKELKQAEKNAGEARTWVVDALYERLGIGPEHGTTRVKNGNEVAVAVDKNEQGRSQRLLDALLPLIDSISPDTLDEIAARDLAGRDERHAKGESERKRRRQAKATTRPSVSAQEIIPEPDGLPEPTAIPVPNEVAGPDVAAQAAPLAKESDELAAPMVPAPTTVRPLSSGISYPGSS